MLSPPFTFFRPHEVDCGKGGGRGTVIWVRSLCRLACISGPARRPPGNIQQPQSTRTKQPQCASFRPHGAGNPPVVNEAESAEEVGWRNSHDACGLGTPVPPRLHTFDSTPGAYYGVVNTILGILFLFQLAFIRCGRSYCSFRSLSTIFISS